MILVLNSAVRTADAFQSSGCVILTMIVETIQTSPPICAGKGTALQGGNDVQECPTTGAFPSGCSATERMIVATEVMSYP